AARIAAAVAEGLERPGGRPRTVHLVGERAGAAAIDAAGAGSDWVDKVGSVTFIDPPAGLTGGYEVADVFVAWRPSENPVSLPDIGARRVELTEANLGSIFTRRGDEIADRESARITGPRQVRAAVDRLTAFVADRMKARGWMTPGHFRDLEFVMGELAGSAAPGGEVSVEVTVRGAPGQQTLTVRVVNQGLGVVPQGLVGMLATVVTADAHHAGGTVTFQLAEARPSTAIVSEAAAVRARRDATRLALHWSEFRRWESARALFDERTGMYLADNGIVGSARARAFHDLTWNQRAALALFDSGSSPATPGMTPAWRDRVERMYIKRKLEALRTWPADLDVHQSADLATYELVERVLEYLDDTAAVLGTTAHLLRLDLDRGIVIALGDVGIAQRVTTHATEPMLRETLPVVMDLVAHRHRLSAAEGAASVLAMAWPMPESPAAFVAEFLTDLMAQRDYYAQLPDGIPHAAEYRKKTVEFADVFDFAWVRRNLESGPEAAAGSPAPAPHQARRQRLLDRVPHDEGMVGLHILRHLVDRPPADGTPPRGSRVDTNGLIGRPGPISPAEWAVRAHADFHPEAFVSPAALGARLADRPGALVAAFFDDPGGTRLLFVRNVDGALEALDVGSLRRTDPRIDGLAAATVQASWRALEPDRRLSGAKAWYGIPFDAEGLPQRALTAGRSTGRAGETMPVQWIGGPPELAGVDSPVPEGETDLHFMYDHPNDCAQVALDCLRAKLPTAGIRDFVSESGARYRGLSPHSFAALTQAGWRPGGYPSVDAVVAEVRDTGAVVAMVIEYEGLATFNAGVGSHVIVVYRHHNETVRLYEKIDGQVLDRPFEEFPANRRVGTVYGIGWNSDGTPLHPLRTGSAPGRDLPSSQLGSSHPRPAQ
ncbi:MAG: hypothetical protein HOQ24_11450, partial [Mycobacteriaceae bacterium]|nr:hypothetical protein [Mycobacteriaceae bacterium]